MIVQALTRGRFSLVLVFDFYLDLWVEIIRFHDSLVLPSEGRTADEKNSIRN